MIQRLLEPKLQQLAQQYPVLTITGPRQSGKTTLAKHCFADYGYVSLEDLDQRHFAQEDPRGFIQQKPQMLIDEVQRVPDLVSYIQTLVDERQSNGQFILTGSHQFELTQVVSQSLAGRTALIKLLPFSMAELKEQDKSVDLNELLYRGFYPRIIDQGLNPSEAHEFYTNTYLQRDLRQLKDIRNLQQFESFLKLCASNIGQLLNKNRLANDVGIDNKTVDQWLSVLQASYIVYLLYPHHNNFRKRITKSPKLYFYDVGLASFLLGIQNETHVQSHPLRGQLFENLVIIDKLKQSYNAAQRPSLYFFRDHVGNEVDLLEDKGQEMYSYEIKSSQTIQSQMFKGLNYYKKLNPNNSKSTLIYTGAQEYIRQGHECVFYRNV